METLEKIKDKLNSEFSCFEIFIEHNEIIIEEQYEMGEDEKNDDDCCDEARTNGEMVIEKFPMLEISNYYCHRHKYAIVALKLCDNLT
jgi:hypothetical protein